MSTDAELSASGGGMHGAGPHHHHHQLLPELTALSLLGGCGAPSHQPPPGLQQLHHQPPPQANGAAGGLGNQHPNNTGMYHHVPSTVHTATVFDNTQNLNSSYQEKINIKKSFPPLQYLYLVIS